MRRLQTLVCTVTVGIMTPGVMNVANAEDAAVKKAIAGQYAKITQGYKTKTLKTILEVTTSDFTIKTQTGQIVTRQQLEAAFSQQMSFLQKVTESSFKINKLTVKGSEATLEVKSTLSGIVADLQQKGKTHALDSVTDYRDVWITAGGVWKRKRSEILKTTLKVDGNDVSAPVPVSVKKSGDKPARH